MNINFKRIFKTSAVITSIIQPNNKITKTPRELVDGLSSCYDQLSNNEELSQQNQEILTKFHEHNGSRLVSTTPTAIYDHNEPYMKNGILYFKPTPTEEIFKSAFKKSNVANKESVTLSELNEAFGEEFMSEIAPKEKTNKKNTKSTRRFVDRYNKETESDLNKNR